MQGTRVMVAMAATTTSRRAAEVQDDEFTHNVDEFPKREMCGVERESQSESKSGQVT